MSEPYALGVDLGTTSTAAAVARGATVRPLTFDGGVASVPSVIFVPAGGAVLVGNAAEAGAAADPSRAIREFKRRMGDPVPAVIGGVPYPIELVMAHLLAFVVRTAVAQEGALPAVIVLTHPANWGDYKAGMLREAARRAGLDADRVVLLTEPEAAAVSHTREHQLAVGDVIAVYDLGGGTFDAALVRRTATRFELIGNPEGMDRLGGIDFDQAVLAHVDRALAGAVTAADRSDPATLPAQAALRVQCRRAKEALTGAADTTIPVALPALQAEVRLTRPELEAMVRPRLADTTRALERAVRSAGLTMDGVSRVLLVGSSSLMPLVGEVVQQATGRTAVLAAQPKLAIATGAALIGATQLAAPAPAAATASVTPSPPAAAAGWQAPVKVAPPEPAKPRRGHRRTAIAAAIGAAVGVAAVIGVVVLTGGDDTITTSAPSTTRSDPAASTTAAPTSPVVVALGDPALVPASLGAGGTGVVVVTTSGAVLQVSATGATPVLGADDITGAAFAAMSADGSLVVSAPSGVWEVRDGAATLVLDAAAAGMGATPGPVALDPTGNLYVADNANHRILRRGTDGSLSLVAGSGVVPLAGRADGDGQRGETIAVGTVAGLLIDRAGRLVFTDTAIPAVRAIDSAGMADTLLGGDTGPAVTAVGGLALNTDGTLLAALPADGSVVRIGTDGTVTTIAAAPGASDVAVTADGTLWLISGGQVTRSAL